MMKPLIPSVGDYIDHEGVVIPIPLKFKSSLDSIALMKNLKGMKAAYNSFVNHSLISWAHECVSVESRNSMIEPSESAIYETFPVKPVFDEFDAWYARNPIARRNAVNQAFNISHVEFKSNLFKADEAHQRRIISRIVVMGISRESTCKWMNVDSEIVDMTVSDMEQLAVKITIELEKALLV